MKLQEAAKVLGMHYVSVHRLRRQGKLVKTPDGIGVEEASVLAYLQSVTRPAGYIEGTEAAERLAIPRREMSKVAAAGLVTALPRPGGGFWVSEESIAELADHPERLAPLGMILAPPAGWITADRAAEMMGCSRSWLSRLGKRGQIRRRQFGRHNTWYLAEDVQKYLPVTP